MSFWRKDATGRLCVNLGGIESPAAGILELFWGEPDIYFTVNGTYEQRGNRYNDETSFKLYSRCERYLKYLNAVVLDLDCHTGPFNFRDSLQMLLAEIDGGGLPRPSLVCSSGRGLWALWLLEDKLHEGQPVRAWPDTLRITKRIGRAVAQRFKHLGADLKTHDGSRLMRVPGSRNSSAAPENQQVTFYRVTGNRYTLAELGNGFGVRAQPTKITLAPDKPKSERHSHAGRRRWSVPLAAIRELEKMRGGFRSGTRRSGLWALAVLMRKNRATADEISRELTAVASRCVPVCNDSDVQDAITASRNVRGRVSNRAFAEMLKIEDAEKARLSFWFKAYQKTKTEAVSDRRAVVSQVLADYPGLSVRAVARIVRSRHALAVGLSTVHRDMLAIAEAQAQRRKPAQRQEWAALAPAMARQEQGGLGAAYV
jgi:hypothetical protein